MKKCLVFIIPLLALSCCLMLGSFSLKEVLPEGIKVIEKNQCNVNVSGDLGFVLESVDSKNGMKYFSNGLLVGECVWFENFGNNLNQICQKLGLIINKRYYTQSHYMIEGISAKIKYALCGTSNIQIAVSEKMIVVGSPIIYGSY